MPLSTTVSGAIPVGAEVRLISSLSRAMHLCLGHGGWVPQMEATLGKVGVVVEVLQSGNLRIQCGSLRPYIYPPTMVAEHLNAQTGPPLFALELHPHSLAKMEGSGQCSTCNGSIQGAQVGPPSTAADFLGDVATSSSPAEGAGSQIAGGFECAACEFRLCQACSTPYRLPLPELDVGVNCKGRHGLLGHKASAGCVCDLCSKPATGIVRGCLPCNFVACEACCEGKTVAEVGLRLGAPVKLEAAGKWVSAVVADTLPGSKVRLHTPMEEVPDEVLEVTSHRIRPVHVEALDLARHPCHPDGLHRVCFPRGLTGTLFGAPIACAAERSMPGGCRAPEGTARAGEPVVAYFCPRTAFLLCGRCAECEDLGEISSATCSTDLLALLDPSRRRVAAERILTICQRSQNARFLFLEAGLCDALAQVAPDAAAISEDGCDAAVLALLTRVAEWLYLSAPARSGRHGRVLIEASSTEASDADSWAEARVISVGDSVEVSLVHDEQRHVVLRTDQVTPLELAEAPPACVPLPKRSNLPSPMRLTQEWLIKHALPRNDLLLAKRVLMDRADLTGCDQHGNSVLAIAVENQCSREMIDLLVSRDCPRVSKGPLGSPTAVAAKYGYLEIVRALLDADCDAGELESLELPDSARRLLGYMVPSKEQVLQKGLPLHRLRRDLATSALLPLSHTLAPSLPGQARWNTDLVRVIVLGAEHATALPADVVDSLVRICRSLVMSFDSGAIELGLRLAARLVPAGGAPCSASRDTLAELERHGVIKMLRSLATTPTLLHQPPRPQHITQAAQDLLESIPEGGSPLLAPQLDPLPERLCSKEGMARLLELTPRELVRLGVPQRLLHEGVPRPLPPELAQLLVQVIEEEEDFTVHVYRERQDVNLRVLTEPFWLFCRSHGTAGSPYVVQAEPLVSMESLDKLLLVTGGFLGQPEYLRQCLRYVGRTLYQSDSEYVVEGVIVLPHVGLPVHILRDLLGERTQRVLALGDYHISPEPPPLENVDLCHDLAGMYKVESAGVYTKVATDPWPMEREDLYLELLLIEAQASGVREAFRKLCTNLCIAIVTNQEDNEVIDAIAQSVEGVLIPEAAKPLLLSFGWQEQGDGDQDDDMLCTLWDPPKIAPELPTFFSLKVEPPAPDAPGVEDPVWSVIISFDPELPFQLVWPAVEMDMKNAFTSVSNKWSEMGWPGGEAEMLSSVQESVASSGEAAVARGLVQSAANRIADRLRATVACRVVADPDTATQASAGAKKKGKLALRDVVEVKADGVWVPSVLVQEHPPVFVTISGGTIATGKHRVLPGFEGPRLYPVPPVDPQVQTRAALASLERGAESSRITRRLEADCMPEAPAPPPAVRGEPFRQPRVAYSLASAGNEGSVSLLRGRDVQVKGHSWVSQSWTTVGLPELCSRGKVYYELHIESHDTPQVGWATEKFRFFGDTWLYGVGDDVESWGVDGARLKIWHGGETGSYPSEWPSSVVVGCAADVAGGILQFSTDGVWVTPPTFVGVRCASLYPAVSGQMTASFRVNPQEWKYAPPDSSYVALSDCARSPAALPAPVHFPKDWTLARSLQLLARRQEVDLLTTLHVTCDIVLDDEAAKPDSRCDEAQEEPFAFVLDSDGHPRFGEKWADDTLDTLGLTDRSPAGASLRVLWRGDGDVRSPRLSAKLNDLCSHQVALVSGSLPVWALRLGVLLPWLFDRPSREVLLRSSAFGLAFAVHDRQTREVSRRYDEVMKAAEERVAQAKNLGDQRTLSQAYENLFELTKQISQDPEVWIGSMTSELAKVERQKVWQQAEIIAECCHRSTGIVEVQFKDETGFGRGVTQGFFSDVAKELQRRSANAEVPMWTECLEDGEFLRSRRGLLIQPLAEGDSKLPAVVAHFRSLGRLIALALRESFVVPLPLSATVLRQLRGDSLGSSSLPQKGDGLVGEFTGACHHFLADLADAGSPEQRRAHADDPGWAARYLGGESAGSFTEWSASAEFLATGFSGPAIGAEGRPVTMDALEEFVTAASDFWLKHGVRQQVEALRRGIHDVLGTRGGALWLFTPDELRELICGEESVNWTSKELYDYIHCGGGFTQDDEVMVWFREELLEMSQTLRSTFLDFATSCPRLPPGGLAGLRLTVSPGTGRYLRSRACANQLYLPRYRSRQELHEMVTEALVACEGHHEVNH